MTDQTSRAAHDEAEAPAEIADNLRSQAFKLMDQSKTAAACLILAAADLAPTCEDERLVADEFSDVIKDFADELAKIHSRAGLRQHVHH